tara:strand:+ start:227 stop:949 length:723 start_codon:yes stop_codon:yes gene_type:complete
MNSGDKPKNRSGSRPPRDRSSQDLSLDTRLAAQEILKDESIGISQPVPEMRDNPPILEWLEARRLRLTVIILAVMALVIFTPVWLEVGHREGTVKLNDALSNQAIWMGKEAGQKDLSHWIEARDIERLRSFYRETRPKILKSLAADGFVLDEDTLSIRVDYERNELFLGALLDHGDEGRFITWAGTNATPPSRPLPKASYASVLHENNDLLTAISLVVSVLIIGIWLLPLLAARRRGSAA